MTHISHRRHDLPGLGSKLQGHVISLSRLDPMLYAAGGGMPCLPKLAATLLVLHLIFNKYFNYLQQ